MMQCERCDVETPWCQSTRRGPLLCRTCSRSSRLSSAAALLATAAGLLGMIAWFLARGVL